MGAVDDAAAEALAEIARDRWKKATHHELPTVVARGDPWPTDLKVELEDVEVAIARTAPPLGEAPGIREIEQLYLDMIAAARDYIYLENQYFTSQKVGEALKKSLEQPAGPEIVVLTRLLSHGWLEELTMHVLRTRLVRELEDADKHGRFNAYCPHIEGLREGTCIDLHSKVMIVDDEWLRIGSSNISNRSMGVDTECDVVLEARGEKRVSAKIREFRNRLLAEHLGADQAEVDRL